MMTIDGAKVFEGRLGGEDDLRELDHFQIVAVNAIKDRFRNIRLPVKAGDREVVATFIARAHAESDYISAGFVPGEGMPDVPQMLGFDVTGPYEPTGISESTRAASGSSSAPRELGRGAAVRGAHSRQSRAARVPPNRDRGGHERAARVLSRRRRESGGVRDRHPEGPARDSLEHEIPLPSRARRPAGKARRPAKLMRVTDLELASRLAFFIWSQGPDEELLALAESNRLSDPKVYAQQIERLFADPRSKSLVTNFAFQWLSVRDIDVVEPDPRLYPNFDADLRAGVRRGDGAVPRQHPARRQQAASSRCSRRRTRS